ncbi:MAG: hypothetical protein CUN55_17330, partial [Phototrophicales bacterium]
PLVGIVIACILTLAFALNSEARESYVADPFRWTDIALIPWFLLNNPLGRLLLIGFSVTIFAGEYQYRTWKTILPSNPRWIMMLVKYVAMSGFIVIALTVTSFIVVAFIGFMNLIVGAPYPPTLNINTLSDFLQDYLLNASVLFFATLVVVGIGILISIITRSVLIGIIAGVFISFIEFLGIPALLAIAAGILREEWIRKLIVFV